MPSIYSIPTKKIDGKVTSLEEYKGNVLLVVNVASKCGLTKQYTALEKIYNDYKGKGFEVLGFPANNFLAQEPGTEEEIKDFCSTQYNVTFPLYSKISVKGDDKHPLYQEFTKAFPKATIGDAEPFAERLKSKGIDVSTTEITWNFEKFLINRNGDIVARIAPDVTPDDERVTKAVEAELAK